MSQTPSCNSVPNNKITFKLLHKKTNECISSSRETCHPVTHLIPWCGQERFIQLSVTKIKAKSSIFGVIQPDTPGTTGAAIFTLSRPKLKSSVSAESAPQERVPEQCQTGNCEQITETVLTTRRRADWQPASGCNQKKVDTTYTHSLMQLRKAPGSFSRRPCGFWRLNPSRGSLLLARLGQWHFKVPCHCCPSGLVKNQLGQ